MKALRWFALLKVALIGLAFGWLCDSGWAVQVSLAPSNVVGGSGSLGGTFSAGGFNATQILDQQLINPSEPNQTGFWLNPDNGPANAYITVDLGRPYRLDQLQLFNTHNANFNDRGTGNFIFRSGIRLNAVNTNGANTGRNLDGTPSTLTSGTLTGVNQANDPITGQAFNVSGNSVVRYLEFAPTSVATGGGNCCGANNYGLNELKVLGTDTQLTLGPSNVIGGSLAYGAGSFNGGSFPATSVLSNQSGDPSETGPSGFWLNPDNLENGTPAYFVVDLGAPTQLAGIELFNTHNEQYNDRGTGQFAITGANAITSAGAGQGFDLSGPTVSLASGTLLAALQANDPIRGELYSTLGSGLVRYVRFDALTGAAGGGLYTPSSFGLNEIKFYAVPEPASFGLMAAGLIGLLAIRRRK